MSDKIKELEVEYLRAKVEYTEGNPIMSDAEFDYLEKKLKEQGSKVIEQVGAKRKDFDFSHPSRMRSLAKLQTEENKELPDGIDYKYIEFLKWYDKNCKKVNDKARLLGSPKFDGNAINIVYRVNKNLIPVFSVSTTRGDGVSGKDITTRFKSKLPTELILKGLTVKENDVIEIRAEVVILLSIFDAKYKGKKEDGKYANARNYVAGVLGKDDYDVTKVDELDILPVHYLVNGNNVDQGHFIKNEFTSESYDVPFVIGEYVDIIKTFIEVRKTHKYLLDGVVIAFPTEYRKTLGENDHDPEWSIAIKFIPEETVTDYKGIEWNVSKRGEITPVILLEPVELAGTIVKRASGYNAGYIVNNQIGPGSSMAIAKAGDIIPEVQKVTIKSTEAVVLPTHCPSCQTELVFDNTHLKCQNEYCVGRIAKKLDSAAKVIGIKGVGGKTLEPFAKDFTQMIQLWSWVLEKGDSKEIEKYGIEYKSRSHEIFVNAFKNIKSILLEKIIMGLGYDNVGKTLSKKLAMKYNGIETDFAGLEKALVEKMLTEEVIFNVTNHTDILESQGVKVDKPELEVKGTNSINVCMTGSPKSAGYKTKAEFLAEFAVLVDSKLDKDCNYLITDDYDSKSSKMSKAKKLGIEIRTYADFKL